MIQGNISPIQAAPNPIDPGVRIGHVHLRTADIDRVRDFYVGVLGFDVVAEARNVPGWGTTGDILFVSAGGYHHHLGFNTWKSADGGPQPDGVAGLHHVALNYPTRAGLADAVRRLQRAGVPLRQLSDHGTHEAVYLSDPDGNDLELAWDRPVAEWPQADTSQTRKAAGDRHRDRTFGSGTCKRSIVHGGRAGQTNHSVSTTSTAPNPRSGPSTKNISTVISGSTCAWERNATTLRPVRRSIMSR